MQRRGRGPRRGTEQHRGQGDERSCGPQSRRSGTGQPRSPGQAGVRPRLDIRWFTTRYLDTRYLDAGRFIRPRRSLRTATGYGHP
ncbi:hypothetical protein DY245_10750 [Streptomyces inhibens]|uniref:Uncharacterized protein n=1 Tax=Streptomyces inhibens TaxID=2293571 RepID=A0A371Q6B6_STRIH|nr:hypothetical protein DY245_10750 [Streptomyces inhibens]